MPSKQSLLLEFDSPCGRYALSFEDDGKVAYAYLKHDGEVVGDVWLYNRCPTPTSPEWKDRKKIPFANCVPYVRNGGRMTKAVLSKNVNVDWDDGANGPVAYIYLFGDLYGVVGIGDKPGYARFAAKDGPLGKVMEIEE
jgi:hypothetical protein